MSTQWKGIKTHYSPNSNETFYITPHGDRFKLTVDPEYRHNGTQNYDGYFPRHFKSVPAAKGCLTKFLGKPPAWTDI